MFQKRFALIASLIAYIGLSTAGSIYAASPELSQVLPRGAQRGTESELLLQGQRLEGAAEVLFYQPGITVTKIENVSSGAVKLHVRIAEDAELGEHTLRLRTATGITELRNFFVGQFPVVMEAAEVGAGARPARDVPAEKRPSTFGTPQKIDLNVTVQGVVESEQVDYYQVQCAKGQRLTAEVEGMRLGRLFDPYVAIVDSSRFELAASDDTSLLKSDPVASCIAPRDGSYIVEVRESSYGGSTESYYRLHVGTFPRPMAVYPCGGMAGEEITLHFIGDVLGPIDQKLKVPDAATGRHSVIGVFADQNGLKSPSPNSFRISSFPNVLEVEPNDELKTATPATQDLPVAFNGIIGKPGDIDFFRFTAKKDQALDLRVFARQLRSPLDSVMILYNAQGNAIASNDDSGGPDSYVRFNVPADGNYFISIKDHRNRGGGDFVYRVEVTPVIPSLLLSIPNNGNQPTQERQAIAIPRGNCFGTLLRATRADFGLGIALSSPDLPPGVTLHCDEYAQGQDVIPVVFEAAPDAPVAGKLCELAAKAAERKEAGQPHPDVKGGFSQDIELVTYQNNGGLYSTWTDKLAVAVTDEAPFTIHIVQPKVPLTQNGSMDLKVQAQRKPGFTGTINLRMLWDPPGVSSGSVSIPGDQNEIAIPLSAQGNAGAHKWKIAVLGQADVAGALWVSTPLADLEVGEAILAMKIGRTAVEQGQVVAVPCDLDQRVPFDGKAKVQLLGLPANATAPDVEIGSQDKQAVFNVVTTANTPAGNHTSLLCRFTIVKDGEPIVETLGQGGVLRVDAPAPPKANPKPAPPPVAAVAPAAAAPAPKPLSRLEKLRLEQQEQQK